MTGELQKNRAIINELFVDLFNNILLLEGRYLKKMGINDLSISEMHILEAIGRKENPAMGDVAQQVLLTNGTVTTAVKRLEEKGYAERRKDDQDRRVIQVRLSDKERQDEAAHGQFHQMLLNEVCRSTDVLADESLINSLRGLQAFLTN